MKPSIEPKFCHLNQRECHLLTDMVRNSFYWALSYLMDTNQQNEEAKMKIRVTSRFERKSLLHSNCTSPWLEEPRIITRNVFLVHAQTTLEVNEISVQFHSLGLYRKNLYWKDFVSKRPVSKIRLPTSYENLKHDLCSRMSCLRFWKRTRKNSGLTGKAWIF